MDKIKPILTVAAGVAVAGLLMYFLGSLPVVKQAKQGFTGSAS